MSSMCHALLSGIVDYAGLFPPAKLEMAATVDNYQRYSKGKCAWMLGHLVVPMSRFAEFLREARRHDGHWSLSLIGQGTISEDFKRLDDLARLADSGVSVNVASVERRMSPDDQWPAIDSENENRPGFYIEVDPLDESQLDRVADWGCCAKIRTGGVEASAFPTPDTVGRFIHRCHERNIPFKATAGLHHPLRSRRKATPDHGAPTVDMHGFVNVFAAAAMLHSKLIDQDGVIAMLESTTSDDFQWNDQVLSWNGVEIDAKQMSDARRDFAHSFGSCSFDEPIDDLVDLAILDANLVEHH